MTRSWRCAAVLAAAVSGAVSAGMPEPADRPGTWTAPPFWSPPAPSASPRPADGRAALTIPPGTPLPFVAVSPCRLVDTRGNAPLTGGFLPPATVRTYTLTGWCGIPSSAQALSLNATVVLPTGPGFLTLYPEGGAFPPVSTLNFLGGDVVVNAAVVPLSGTGGISMALGVSGGDVILDVNGYYAPTPSVTSLNALTGDVALAAGANVTLTPAGNTLTVAAAGPPASLPPSGPAGGALSGSYPNPDIAAGAVGSTKIAAGTVVRSLNGVTENVSLAAGNNITITPAGSTLTIATPVAPTGRAIQTAAQTIANNTFVTVNLGTMAFSSQTSLAGNAITIARTGVYQIVGEIQWATNGTGLRFLSVNLANGLEIAVGEIPAASAAGTMMSISTLARLNAGDAVHMLAFQFSGGNLATEVFHGRSAALNVSWVAP